MIISWSPLQSLSETSALAEAQDDDAGYLTSNTDVAAGKTS